jgi:hypothetical protein
MNKLLLAIGIAACMLTNIHAMQQEDDTDSSVTVTLESYLASAGHLLEQEHPTTNPSKKLSVHVYNKVPLTKKVHFFGYDSSRESILWLPLSPHEVNILMIMLKGIPIWIPTIAATGSALTYRYLNRKYTMTPKKKAASQEDETALSEKEFNE